LKKDNESAEIGAFVHTLYFIKEYIVMKRRGWNEKIHILHEGKFLLDLCRHRRGRADLVHMV